MTKLQESKNGRKTRYYGGLRGIFGTARRVRRRKRPLSISLIDLDRFKHVNDTYGHLAGDRVLRGLGRLLRSRFRSEDVRGRWGGEEFVVGLYEAATANSSTP